MTHRLKSPGNKPGPGACQCKDTSFNNSNNTSQNNNTKQFLKVKQKKRKSVVCYRVLSREHEVLTSKYRVNMIV